MRWIVLLGLLWAACGGSSDCSVHNGSFGYIATQTQLIGASCSDLATSFPVALSIATQADGSFVLSGTENTVAFTAPASKGVSSNCIASPVWYDATSWHMYFLPLGGGSPELHIGRTGQCMAVYSLR